MTASRALFLLSRKMKVFISHSQNVSVKKLCTSLHFFAIHSSTDILSVLNEKVITVHTYIYIYMYIFVLHPNDFNGFIFI